ncbi:ankyrin repeat domain-containing protein 34A, partial [Hirundo rustica]|uniref:ankyrin repeat domain-containing protein 34A n=1 Tax=Hirundo rustica TaxID=43150 RepID=UPI001A93C3AF
LPPTRGRALDAPWVIHPASSPPRSAPLPFPAPAAAKNSAAGAGRARGTLPDTPPPHRDGGSGPLCPTPPSPGPREPGAGAEGARAPVVTSPGSTAVPALAALSPAMPSPVRRPPSAAVPPGLPMIPAEGSALLRAVSQGKFRLTRLLLEGGAYINEGNAAGTTPLMAACCAGYADPPEQPRMVRYLLENGADPNIPDKSGKTALMHACSQRAGPAVAAVLLEHGADPSARDYSGGSALLYALERGDRETLQVLLDACRERGRDVIIITSATSPCGTKTTRQYLNSPPSPALCASPSQVQVRAAASPGAAGSREEESDVFRFPPAPERNRAGHKRQLKRLNSEPWGLTVPAAAAEGMRGHPEETRGSPEGTRGPPEGAGRPLDETRRSLEGTRGSSEGSWGSPEGSRGSLEGASVPAERLAVGLEGLRLRPRRHSVEGREVSGLPGSTWAERVPPVPAPRGKPLRRDPSSSAELSVPGPLRHPAALLERRGSGTLPLEPPGPGRAGLLPPLPPRALLRRHSMQPEALRHLGAFCGPLGPEPGS